MAEKNDASCEEPGCCARPSRREFLQVVGLGAVASIAGADEARAMAGPFDASEFARLVPPDKKLDAAWVKSLLDRGERTIYHGPGLTLIGMPIGGICAGQLYLGGDGKLWHWDIFNRVDHTNEAHYANPMRPQSLLDQGFALRIKNVSHEAVEVEIGGRLENAVCLDAGQPADGFRRNVIRQEPGVLLLECSAEPAPQPPARAPRPPIVLADFDGETYGAWTAEGQAFGTRPSTGAVGPEQHLRGFQGKGLVNTWTGSDGSQGKLTSPSFTIDRDYLNFLIGGGNHPNETCINLKVEGQIVRTATGKSTDAMEWAGWNVHDLHGKTARIEIVDRHSGDWGHIDPLRLGRRRRPVHQQAPDAARAGNPALAAYLVRLHTALLVPGPDVRQHVDPGHIHLPAVQERPILRLGTCRLLRGHVHSRLALCPCSRPAFPRAGTDLARAGGLCGRHRLRPENRHHQSPGRGAGRAPAVDGQAGNILRAYREHQMSADPAFLKRLWPRVKASLEYLIRHGPNSDGLLEGPQHNTLDAEWFGLVPWLSSLYIAALAAGEAMARELGDLAFARPCRLLADRGSKNIVGQLWNEPYGYFIQRPDPANAQSVGSYDGCEINQVFGQHWAFQVGLGRILSAPHVKRALQSLWTYTMVPRGTSRSHP